jgi:tetratricopeptide (TPR) repeat protein
VLTASGAQGALHALASGITEALEEDASSAGQQRLFCCALEAAIANQNDALLLSVASETTFPQAARALGAQALARLQPEAAVPLLERIAHNESCGMRARILAFEGLRCLLPLARWSESLDRVDASTWQDPQVRDAISRIWMKATRQGNAAVTFTARGDRSSYESGLIIDYFDAHGRAMAYLSLDRFEESLAVLRQLAHARPNDPRTEMAIASVLSQLGRFDESVAHATQALSLDPGNTKALNTRAYAYSQLGQVDRALRDIDRSIEIGPEDPADRLLRAHFLERLGRFDEALREKAIANRLAGSRRRPSERVEAPQRKMRDDDEDNLTQETLHSAVAVMRRQGFQETVTDILSHCAIHPDTPMHARAQALDTMYQLERLDALDQIVRNEKLPSLVRVRAAAGVIGCDMRRQAHGESPSSAFSFASEYLDRCADLAATLKAMTGSEATGSEPGAAVRATSIVVDAVRKRGATRFADLAADGEANPWLRVQCCRALAEAGFEGVALEILRRLKKDPRLPPALGAWLGELDAHPE